MLKDCIKCPIPIDTANKYGKYSGTTIYGTKFTKGK
jgi:hypothetical protein